MYWLMAALATGSKIGAQSITVCKYIPVADKAVSNVGGKPDQNEVTFLARLVLIRRAKVLEECPIHL